MQRAIPFFFLLTLILLSNCLDALYSPVSADEVWLGLAGGEEKRVTDPIFEQQAYVYEVGREHKQSVVLVHGLGHGAANDWQHLIPVLAKKYHVLTFDLPGFGRSDMGNKDYEPSTYAQFIHFLTQKYIKGPFVLIGHSMGGAIATLYTARYPQDVSKLVLIDAAGILQQVAFEKSLANSAARKMAPGYEIYDAEIRQLISKIIDISSFINVGPDLVMKLPPLRQTILGGDPVKIAGLGLVLEDFSRHVPLIHTQTLLLWGAQDPVAPVRTGMMLDELLPDSALITIPDTGHNPMLEKPEQLNRLVMDFLANDRKLLDKFKIKASKPDLPTLDKLQCRGERGMVYTGVYKEIEIIDCDNITLDNVATGRMVIHNSTVNMINSYVDGKEFGIYASGSDVRITNGSISGDIAIEATECRFDIAGTHLLGRQKLAVSKLPSNFIFSIVLAETPLERRYLHEFKVVSSLATM